MATVGRAEVKIVADARGFSRDAEREIRRELSNIRIRDSDSSPIRNGLVQGAVAAGTAAGASAASQWLKQFGIVLQGGISSKFAGALGAVAIGALGPVMLIVGTLAGGLLISGMGSVLAGLGILIAAQEPQVKNAFVGMFSRVFASLQEISRPFVGVLIEIAQLAEETFVEHFEEPLRRAFGDLAPAVEEFAGFLAEAFAALAPTIEPVTDAFIAILEELGPALAEEVFPDLADAIINLANAIGDNADAFVDILTWFLSIPEAVINFLAELARLAGWFQDNPEAIIGALTAIGAVLGFLVAGPVGLFVGAVIGLGIALFQFRDKAQEVFNRLREIVLGWVLSAVTWFRDFRDRVLGFLAGFGRGAKAIFEDFRDKAIERVRRLGEGIRNIFNNVVDFIKRLPGRIASAASGMWNSIWTGFRGVVNNVIDGWNRLSFSMPGVETPFGTLGGFTINTPNIPRLQSGGMIERAGIAEVGEAGRETVFLPAGAVVAPGSANQVAQQMTGGELPDEFEATVVIDLGEDIQRIVRIPFRRVTRTARKVGRRAA